MSGLNQATNRQPAIRVSGFLVPVLSGLIVFALLVAVRSYFARSDQIAALRLAPGQIPEVSANEGDRVVTEFVFRNVSGRALKLSKLSTSCTCLVVETPASLPLDVSPAQEVRIITSMKAEPSFLPVNLQLKADTEASGVAQSHVAVFRLFCRSRFRASPAVVTFGELDRMQAPRSASVLVFEEEAGAESNSITTATATHPALLVEVDAERMPAAGSEPSHYHGVGVLNIALDPSKVTDPFRGGKIEVVFSSGHALSVPVAARVD